MQVCYVAKGYSDAVPVFSDDQHSNIYGAWNVEYAKKYGYFNEEKSRERTQAAEKIPAETMTLSLTGLDRKPMRVRKVIRNGIKFALNGGAA